MVTNLLRRLLIVGVLAFSVLAISNVAIADSPKDPPYPHPVLDPTAKIDRGRPYPQLNPDGTNADTLPRDTRFDSLDNGVTLLGCISGPYGCFDPLLCNELGDLGRATNGHRCTRTTYYLCDAQHSCNNPNACGINPYGKRDIVAVATFQYPRCQGTFQVLSPAGGLWGYMPNRDVDGYQAWNWVDILNHNIGDYNWLKLQ
jgi:hypothetical protein